MGDHHTTLGVATVKEPESGVANAEDLAVAGAALDRTWVVFVNAVVGGVLGRARRCVTPHLDSDTMLVKVLPFLRKALTNEGAGEGGGG